MINTRVIIFLSGRLQSNIQQRIVTLNHLLATGTKMLQVNLHMATNSDALVNSQVKITVQWKTSH